MLKTLQALNWYWTSIFLLVAFMLRWISYCHISTDQFSLVLVQEIGFLSQMHLTVLCINVDHCSYIVRKGVSMHVFGSSFPNLVFLCACVWVFVLPEVRSNPTKFHV